jgi:hypothetical protein
MQLIHKPNFLTQMQITSLQVYYLVRVKKLVQTRWLLLSATRCSCKDNYKGKFQQFIKIMSITLNRSLLTLTNVKHIIKLR